MKITPGRWYRTCQECGHQQAAKQPPAGKELTDSYRNAKCRKCHSEALDYGTTMPGETKLAVCRNCGEEFDVEVQDVQNLAAVDTGKDPIEFECCLKGSFGGPT